MLMPKSRPERNIAQTSTLKEVLAQSPLDAVDAFLDVTPSGQIFIFILYII